MTTTSILEKLIDGISHAGAKQPGADPRMYGVDVTREVPYRATGLAEHQLDVYRKRDLQGPAPVVLYVHGGGFRLMSKDSHWMMAMAFARRGYVVFNINYRLAPEHTFPGPLQDVNDAYLWIIRNAHRYGGDASRIVVAGESAGANLVTSLTLQTTTRRPEPWAQRVFDAGVVPEAVIAYCGIYEVSNIERLLGDKWYPESVRAWVRSVETGYLGDLTGDAEATELADPVRLLERGDTPDRALPPFFLSVGADDVLVQDNVRLADALRKQGVTHESNTYDGQGHAFQMLTWRSEAKDSWNDTFDFLADHGALPQAAASQGPSRITDRVRERIISVMAA